MSEYKTSSDVVQKTIRENICDADEAFEFIDYLIKKQELQKDTVSGSLIEFLISKGNICIANYVLEELKDTGTINLIPKGSDPCYSECFSSILNNRFLDYSDVKDLIEFIDEYGISITPDLRNSIKNYFSDIIEEIENLNMSNDPRSEEQSTNDIFKESKYCMEKLEEWEETE